MDEANEQMRTVRPMMPKRMMNSTRPMPKWPMKLMRPMSQKFDKANKLMITGSHKCKLPRCPMDTRMFLMH